MATGGTPWGVAAMFAPMGIGIFIFASAAISGRRSARSEEVEGQIIDPR